MKQYISIPTVCLAALVAQSVYAENDYLKAFPAASDGMTRYVINLPDRQRGEEDGYRVEIVVGETMLTDGVNRMRLGGSIQAKPLKGWGFTFYEVEKLGPAASTLIGVPPDQPKVEKFVPGPSTMIRYNSRIPLVVYVPAGAEVRYRIWKAPEKFAGAKEG